MKKNNFGFTLIEILIGILIFSIILIGSFQVLSQLGIARTKLMTETNIEKNAIYFSQKFFEEIKEGGDIDYEEYFNRKVFNTGKSDLYLSGHYKENSGFGNSGSIYYCLSASGTTNDKKLLKYDGTNFYNEGCFSGALNSLASDQKGNKQRYGEYILQFIDYNSDANGDNGDSDGDGNFIGDNDDSWLGRGPEAFELNKNLRELYLISADKKHRTLFRYNVKVDPNAPSGKKDCSSTDGINYTGSGCLGTIEFLKLDGKDWGIDHDQSSTGAFDGKIDTWLINSKFSSANAVIAGNGDYWQPLFDDSINVENVEFYLYPNKNTNLTWKENNDNTTASYLKLKMTLSPSWQTKRQIKGKIPKINITTTISLNDILSN